ncbi:SCO6880 family protein [Tessaracoccus antarcticus]|uniref:PrgI family protein n=1 Tax=Tessaracoccus antarcticus TaxID=2479848 RepID=A0A3M0G0Y1_9ACTN|nr:SCO6880 family protein [Tessaracoccus antarcticus]RMB57847.1 PrgI family protein [Tessaracoccus antarcticus]
MPATTFRNFTHPTSGWLFGLGPAQLAIVIIASFPIWISLSNQRWAAVGIFTVVWGVVVVLTVVPLGGRSSTGWMIAAAAYAIASLAKWSVFSSRAERGLLHSLGDLDMPGVLAPIDILEGPPVGLDQRRMAVIKNTAARTWAITASIQHGGTAMSDEPELARFASALTELVDVAARGEMVEEIHLMVRATPDDCAERELWLREHITDTAPKTSVATNIELLRWGQAATRTETFLTLVIPETRLAREAKHLGGQLAGRMNTLTTIATEVDTVLTGAIGATDVAWLTSPELAAAVRTGFAPADRVSLIHATARHKKDQTVVTDVPWALAGPTHTTTAVRHYTHDAWHTITATLKLPEKGTTMGALGAVLFPSQAMERRSITVVFPIEKQSTADRKASQAEFTTSLGQGLRDRLGVRTGIKDRRNKDKIDQVETQLALGATLTHPYVVCSTTVPQTAPINEFGRRLDAAIRQAGFAPQRLDMSQDCAFVTANIPLGISLTRKGLL